MKEFYIPSCGKGNIHCCIWEPKGEVRGVVQIVHGIAEHIARYDALANYLTKQGFVVVGDDHMGHGGSISDDTTKGYFYGGWLAAVEDTYALCKKTKAEYPKAPYFIYGHSMGSFMTRTILYRHPEAGFAGAILSGTGWQPQLVLKIGQAVCKLAEKKHGDKGCSNTVKKLMFGGYNKSYQDVQTEYDWLSGDREAVKKYMDDPLCGFDATIGLSSSLLTGIGLIEKKENLDKMPKNLPVYIFSGDCDPVGAMGKGVKKTAEAFRKAGMKEVSLKLYPQGRHEMHNERNKAQVYQDILNFLKKHS